MAAASRIRMPERAKAGEIIEVRTLMFHPMESGFRLDNKGQPIPRHIVEDFTCSYAGAIVFRARLYPAVATNPYVVFHVRATVSDELLFRWTDDHGVVVTERLRLEVTPG
ncbi:MAG: thiosulfate oxidation carrier complex protein SoxZ [Burkholderiales bacterium]|nr:thiosulfate oxidation carrier complex protein SoxZ [Burkholderiales bacterium]